MKTETILRAVQFVGSIPRTLGRDASGDAVTVERIPRAPGGYRVVRVRENGFTVSMESGSSIAVANHVAAALTAD